MRGPALALLLLGSLLVAGCAEPTNTAAVGPVDDLVREAFATVTTVLDPEGGTGEPSFGVTPDGVLFANGDGGRGGGVYRSLDNGTTWERIATPNEPMPNLDPDLAVDVDGTVWFDGLWIGCTAVSVSRDAGETWGTNLAACNAPVSDRQYVVPTKGGTAYLYSHQLPTFYQMAAKTTDYGATWVPTAPVEIPDHFLLLNEGSGWGGGGFWNPVTDSVFFTWTWAQDGVVGPGGWGAGYAVTRDGGASWENGFVPSMGGRQLGLGLVVGAADEAGNVYLAWGEGLEEGVAIYVAASADDGMTWTAPIRVDNGTTSKVFPAITAGAPGKVAIAYYEANEAAYPSDVSAEGLWNVTLAYTEDIFGNASFERGTLSAAPVKQGPICINGTSCEGDREFLDYFQIHRLPSGQVGAIYNSLLDVEGTLVQVYSATSDAMLR